MLSGSDYDDDGVFDLSETHDQDAEWDAYEDLDDASYENQLDEHKGATDNDDTFSKYSSETLSSTRSKRPREDDEDGSATFSASRAATPGV